MRNRSLEADDQHGVPQASRQLEPNPACNVSLLRGSIRLEAFTGTVADKESTTATQTHVQGHGGGQDPFTGLLNPIRISSSSTTTTQTTIYLQGDDGSERWYQWSVNSLQTAPIRKGHRITMVAAFGPDGRGLPYWYYAHASGVFRNIHTTPRVRLLRFSRAWNALRLAAAMLGVLFVIGVPILVVVGLASLVGLAIDHPKLARGTSDLFARSTGRRFS